MEFSRRSLLCGDTLNTLKSKGFFLTLSLLFSRMCANVKHSCNLHLGFFVIVALLSFIYS